MAIEIVELQLIEDNPYQSRQTYHKQDIADLAASIKQHGLLEFPVARRTNDRVELAFGHLRKKAFLKLAKEDPESYGTMPLQVRDLTNDEMAVFALEENLKRRDITPIEVARAVDKYLVGFTDKTEADLAGQLNMTQANISNMRRVLRLPEQVLEKIDLGRINFTMGRELLIFQGLADEKGLMLEAIRDLRTEGKAYGEPNTVEGMQKAMHSVANVHLAALDKGYTYYNEPLFDTREAGCLQCEQMIRTHPTKSQTAHWCTNKECWDRKQQEHKDKVAAEARAKMTEDVLHKVAEVETKRKESENISQEIIEAEAPPKGVVTPEEIQVYEEAIVEEDEERARVESVKQLGPKYPCHGCLNVKRCDRTTVYAGDDGTLHCDQRVTKETAGAVKEKATVEIPEELRSLIEEKAGTRAQVLDLNELYLSRWQRELKQGYALLSDVLEHIAEPDECLERCTQGFHYGFDSQRSTGQVLYICTNPKCLARKKSAFTRAKNAQGQAKKKAEVAAIRKAITETNGILDGARMQLIVLAQLEGYHTDKYLYGGRKAPLDWFWDKINPQVKDRSQHKLLQAIDKLSRDDLAKMIVEFMLESLTYKGNLEDYEIRTTKPLKWMGIELNIEEKQTT